MFKTGRSLEAWFFLPVTLQLRDPILQEKKKKQKVAAKKILVDKEQRCCGAMKTWYITYTIKLRVKDEIHNTLLYLSCDAPPKYIPSLNKNMLRKKPKASLKNFK